MSTEKDNLCRQFSTTDIKNFRKNLTTVIIAPYNESQVKGVGYNLTASNMVYSLAKRKLLTIYDYKDGRYFKLGPHDTALVLSNEYFKLDSNVAGNFYSRVRRVSEGLGHISTTLDPNWQGMFLIAINNTTNRRINVQLSTIFEGVEEKIGIATVVLTGIKSEKDDDNTSTLDDFNLDNPAMRIDILKELSREPNHFMHNSGYRKFKKLVEKLDNFTHVETDIYKDINKIKEHLIEIRNALKYENDVVKAKSLISSLDWFNFDKNEELKLKINDLKKYLDDENYYIHSQKVNEIDDKITVLKRECDYILLCENVKQIHTLIDSQVNFYQKFSKIKKFFAILANHRSWLFITTVLMIIVALLLKKADLLPDGSEIPITVAAAILPSLIDSIISKTK